MTLIESIISGAIQGITESLPISSSGHLELYRQLFGIEAEGGSVFFDLCLHVGSLIAVLAYFHKDIIRILRKDRLMILWITVGTFSFLAVGGAIAKGLHYEDNYGSNLWFLAFSFILTGTALFLSERLARRHDSPKPLDWKSSLLIGAAEGIAVMRGVSRSGMTISASLMLGIDKKEAARFSFLLFIPAILVAIGYKIMKNAGQELLDADMVTVLPGTIAAFIMSLVTIHLIVRIVEKQKFSWFAFYVWAVGLIALYLAINNTFIV